MRGLRGLRIRAGSKRVFLKLMFVALKVLYLVRLIPKFRELISSMLERFSFLPFLPGSVTTNGQLIISEFFHIVQSELFPFSGGENDLKRSFRYRVT